MDYKNTEYNELNLPISIEVDQDKKEEIIAAIKESDLKCIVASSDDNVKITLSINDLEALEKIMLPFKPVEDSKIIIPRPEKKEKLLPILNGVSKLFDRSITRLNEHIITAQGRVMETNDKLHILGQNITTLMSRNAMLSGVAISFPFFAAPVNALIRRNEKKIERMQNKQIPRLEQQLQIHQNTLDRLNKRSDHLETRKSVCINLSSVISSFAILNKTERSEKYLSSMVGLNTSLQKINTEKMQQLNSRITDLSSQLTSLSPIDKAKAHKQLFKLSGQVELLTEKNKMLNGANVDFTEMLANINSKVHEKIEKAEAAIDKATDNTIKLDNIDQVVITANTASSELAAKLGSTATLFNDRDGDHIPDHLDGTFSPEGFRTQTDVPPIQEPHDEDKPKITEGNKNKKNEYRMAVVSEDEFNELKAQNFSFSKSRKKAEDGKIVIKYKATEREQFEKLIAALAVGKVALHV